MADNQNTIMILNTINFLEDFRCFKKNETINFHDQVTVITGDNGSGKSTLISSIRSTFKSDWSSSNDPHCENKIYTNIENSEEIEISYLCFSEDLLKNAVDFSDNITLHIQTMSMSSGEGSLEQLVDKLESNKDKPLIILDEPERGLSMKRQILVYKYLKKHLLENPSQQMIIVSHSSIIMKLVDLVYSASHKKYIENEEYTKWMFQHNSMSAFDDE
jgi:predicted ATPase